MNPPEGVPRVFISYSHDSPEHADRVLELADRLRAEGIDCHLDQYETSPPEGWPRWMLNQVEAADFVLVICTETYNLRFRGKAESGTGLTAKWGRHKLSLGAYGAGGAEHRVPARRIVLAPTKLTFHSGSVARAMIHASRVGERTLLSVTTRSFLSSFVQEMTMSFGRVKTEPLTENKYSGPTPDSMPTPQIVWGLFLLQGSIGMPSPASVVTPSSFRRTLALVSGPMPYSARARRRGLFLAKGRSAARNVEG
jgi:hypothetical protein